MVALNENLLSEDTDYMLTVGPEELSCIDNRNGEIKKSHTCLVCGECDVLCASSRKAYKHGCTHCMNTDESGEPLFPKRDDAWYRSKKVKGHKSKHWKTFVTIYRKAALAGKFIDPSAAVLLEYIANTSNSSGLCILNKSKASSELNISRNTVIDRLAVLTEIGAVRDVRKEGTKKSRLVVSLIPLKGCKKTTRQNRTAAFLKAVVNDDRAAENAARDAAKRDRLNDQSSSAPITRESRGGMQW